MAEDKTEPTAEKVAEPERPWEVTTERFVAFFDIMGFKDRVQSQTHEQVLKDLKKIKDVINVIENSAKDKKTQIAVFSDSIILFTEDDSKDSLLEIITSSCILISYALINNIPIKGAISCGKISADIKTSLFFGKPIINAYLLHEELYFYGAVVDASVEEKIKEYQIEELGTNVSKAVVQYNTPFKFGRVNHYVLDWTSIMQILLRRQKDKDPLKIIENLSFSMSGKPRIYLDNTLVFFKQYYKLIKVPEI